MNLQASEESQAYDYRNYLGVLFLVIPKEWCLKNVCVLNSALWGLQWGAGGAIVFEQARQSPISGGETPNEVADT